MKGYAASFATNVMGVNRPFILFFLREIDEKIRGKGKISQCDYMKGLRMDDMFRFLFKDKKERKDGIVGGWGAGEC